MDFLQGHLLIASSDLLDPNFARTVVLVIAHGEEGALGLILNREMSVPIEKVWAQLHSSPCPREGFLRHGGPVGGTLMALHDQTALANLTVAEDLFVATEMSAMELLVTSEEGRAQFYIGHSGWGPGQLEDELQEGSWLVLPATASQVFHEIDTIGDWKKAMTEVGQRQIHSVVPIRHVPENPRLN